MIAVNLALTALVAWDRFGSHAFSNLAPSPSVIL